MGDALTIFLKFGLVFFNCAPQLLSNLNDFIFRFNQNNYSFTGISFINID